MSAFPQNNNNNQDMTPMFYAVQNIPKRSYPQGCASNNTDGVGNCNMQNAGNCNIPNQFCNLPNNNNVQPQVTNCAPMQPRYPNQNSQNVPYGPQHMFPVQNSQPAYATPVSRPPIYSPMVHNSFNPLNGNSQPYCIPSYNPQFGPYMNSNPAVQFPCSISQPVGFSTPVSSTPPWNVNPWSTSYPNQYTNFQPPAMGASFPRVPIYQSSKFPHLQVMTQTPSPKPLGKLLFPTIFDFKQGSFFKMLIHMSGFEAKNINISANRTSMELKAVIEEIEKQVKDFSGYILKQVTRVYYFPEPIDETKVQISISEDVIGILIPWRQNA